MVALLTVRNEELYLQQQNIDVCLIYNDSTYKILAIAERFLGRGMFRIEQLPFNVLIFLPPLHHG